MERNREAHVKLVEKQKRPGKRSYRSQEAIEQERSLAKWTSTKVGGGWPPSQCREELCMIQEAYQFFRQKYSSRYDAANPTPTKFL